jgi:hypothetical protein
MAASSRALSIGNRAGLDRGFAGTIDAVRAYNGVLSAADLAAIYVDDKKYANPIVSPTSPLYQAPIVFLRTGAQGAAPASQPKALLLSLKSGGRDALVFSPKVAQVAIMGLDGRVYFRASSSGGQLVIPVDSSLQLPTGYSLLKAVDADGASTMVGIVRAR